MVKTGFPRRLAKLICLPVLALGLLVTGCTSDGSGDPGDASAPADSALAKIIDRGKIRVAVLADYPPFGVQNASGDLEGYEPDIAKKLAEALGVDLELVTTDGSSRLPLLEADRVDVNISAWTATNERAKAVGFTVPYVSSGALPLFLEENPLESYDDLKGKKVSVARGSTNDTIMTTYFPDTEIERFESIADAIAAVKAKKVDAAIEGQFTVEREVEANPELATLDGPPLRPAIISMGVLPEDQVFLNYLNNFIRNLTSSGDNQDLYRKWFDADLPEAVQ